MSAFTQITTALTDISNVKKALVAMGWKDTQIEVHDKPQRLNGYHGGENRQAHLIIRRENLNGGGYNDLGFEKQADGTIRVHGEYAGQYGRIDGERFRNTLNQEYALAKLTDELAHEGFFLDKVDRKDGQIFVTAENPYMA